MLEFLFFCLCFLLLARLRFGSQNDPFKKVRILGSGVFASVDLCTVEEDTSYAKSGDQVAVKRLLVFSSSPAIRGI